MDQQERIALAFVEIMVAAPINTQFVRSERVQAVASRKTWGQG